MGIREKTFDLHPEFSLESLTPVHFQVYESIMRELRQQNVPAGTVLPSILALANSLKLNHATIRKAYLNLEEKKVITRRPGGRIFEVTEEFVAESKKSALTAVGIVLPDRMESLIAGRATQAIEIVAGIMDCAADLGFTAMVVPLPEQEDRISRLEGWLKRMLSQLNGLIYLGESNKHCHDKAFELLLAEKSLPQVVVSGRDRFMEYLGLVQVEMRSGIEKAIRYLHKQKHHRIAVVGYEVPIRKMFQLQTYDRLPELLRGIGEIPDELLVTGSMGDDFKPQLTRLLTQPEPPTAVLCSCHELAMKLLETAGTIGGKIAKKLEIVQYDSATYADPRFSTIIHPYMQTGRAAVEMIAESRLKATPVHQLKRVLEAEFFPRSCNKK